MGSTGVWKNCRIILKDQANEKIIADTRILSVAPGNHAVKVRAGSVSGQIGERVNALIFSKNGMLQYRGMLRGPIIANELEVVLHAGGKKEDRQCVRYSIQTEGIIEEIIIDGERISLEKPIEVVTVNMGTKGILIRTFPGTFAVGDRMQLKIWLGEKEYVSDYEIVRIQNSSTWNEEYGCRDIRQNEES